MTIMELIDKVFDALFKIADVLDEYIPVEWVSQDGGKTYKLMRKRKD